MTFRCACSPLSGFSFTLYRSAAFYPPFSFARPLPLLLPIASSFSSSAPCVFRCFFALVFVFVFALVAVIAIVLFFLFLFYYCYQYYSISDWSRYPKRETIGILVCRINKDILVIRIEKASSSLIGITFFFICTRALWLALYKAEGVELQEESQYGL